MRVMALRANLRYHFAVKHQRDAWDSLAEGDFERDGGAHPRGHVHVLGNDPRPGHDLLPRDRTEGHLTDRLDTIPHPPSVPRDLLDAHARAEAAHEPVEGSHVGPLSEMPDWAVAVMEEMQRTRSELSAVLGEFVDAAAALERQNREVLANQNSLRRSFDDLRSEFRSRVGAHDGEFNDVRSRLTILEKDLADLNEMLRSIMMDDE